MALSNLVETNNLHLHLASGEVLGVREFLVEEALSQPFDVRLVAVSSNPDVDFEAAIGQPARFEVDRPLLGGPARSWGGICAAARLIGVEEKGLSTYSFHIVPELWLLTQRRNYRIFQDLSELEITLAVLAEWGIAPRLDLHAATYPKRRFRVQYAESDFAFISRLLEDIGVTYHFAAGEGTSQLVLVDAPNQRAAEQRLPFVATPMERIAVEYVTALQTERIVRPGRYTQSDVDYRKALDYPLAASAGGGRGIEARLERYHHNYGSFLWKSDGGGETPAADDRGAARTDEAAGRRQVRKRLDAQRVEARSCWFKTTAHDLAPGMVMNIVDHPRAEVGAPLLIVRGRFSGTAVGDWSHHCEARYTDVDFRPALSTPKPRTAGVESATVTGPAGEEIHTDEFGRVRLHFHWDREGASDETSSCWVPVSQPWAGAGFGAVSLPRVGQEVLVDFLGADPDRPVVVGRVFTTTTPPPYELPKYKMVGGMRSESYPRPKPAAKASLGGGPPAPVPVPPGAALRRPSGGGPRPASLGGFAEHATLAESRADQIMPGAHGAPPANLEELREAITRMKAGGPDGEDAGRSGNAVTTDDTAGGQILYMQGEQDVRLAAKHSFVGSVGANRAFEVLGNDFERIVGFQATGVEKDRVVEVTGIQRHTVAKDIFVDGAMNHTVTTEIDFKSTATSGGHIFDSKAGTSISVDGKSKIIMLPDGIVIDAPIVFINPGSAMMDALAAGMGVMEAAEAAQQQAAAEAAAAQAAADKAAAQEWFAALDERGIPRPSAEQLATMRSSVEQYSYVDPGYGLTDYSDWMPSGLDGGNTEATIRMIDAAGSL